MPKTTRSAVSSAGQVVDDDAGKTVVQWKKLNVETLRLKCNQYHLVASGKKPMLIERLVSHFASEKSAPKSSVSMERRNLDNAPSHENKNNNNKNTSPSTASGTDFVVGNEVEDITTITETNSEVRALRSLVEAMQNSQQQQQLQQGLLEQKIAQQQQLLTQVQRPFSQPAIISSQQQLSEATNLPLSSHVLQQQHNNNRGSVHLNPRFMAPSAVRSATPTFPLITTTGNHTAALTTGNNNNFNIDETIGAVMDKFNGSNKKSFTLPPIKRSILIKIEKREYVDFEDLLSIRKPSTGQNSRSGGAYAREFVMVSDDLETDEDSSAPLRLRQRGARAVVRSLANWMFAWNRYMQASCYFFPESVHDRFCYQQIIVTLANRYKFEAVYGYDCEFRMAMAAESAEKPENRTVKWEVQAIHLTNMFLTNDTLLPECFECKEVGHYANMCPTSRKSKRNPLPQQFRNAPLPHVDANISNNKTPPAYDAFRKPPTNFTGQGYNSPRPQAPPRPCARFNRGVYCDTARCYEPHICSKCFREGHPSIQCGGRGKFQR